MKNEKTLLWAAAAVTALLLLAPAARAQTEAQAQTSGPFSDVPRDHWAFEAVEKLRKAGIVQGYPDGTYGGGRPLTRFEFATGVGRLVEGLPSVPAGAVTKGEVTALRNEAEGKFATKQEVEALRRRLVGDLRPQLDRQKQSVNTIGSRLGTLESRLSRPNPR